MLPGYPLTKNRHRADEQFCVDIWATANVGKWKFKQIYGVNDYKHHTGNFCR